ncbi:uncharacterized protein [Asterias amurensis]|uniref:uncharacterized protein n=1 Tax=Asterias amurensis TaxID=7602 RepID=UPI003AB2AE30
MHNVHAAQCQSTMMSSKTKAGAVIRQRGQSSPQRFTHPPIRCQRPAVDELPNNLHGIRWCLPVTHFRDLQLRIVSPLSTYHLLICVRVMQEEGKIPVVVLH